MIQITKNKVVGHCGIMEEIDEYCPVRCAPRKSDSNIGADFLNPVGGWLARLPSQGFCFVGGIKTLAQDLSKAQTRGRSIRAKCSPMERRTLPRRPILQKVLSRPKDAVLLWDCRDGPVRDAIKGKRRGLPCPSLHSTETRTVLQ